MRDIVAFIGAVLLLCGIPYFLWATGPRLWSDLVHANDFVPAQEHVVTQYRCKNWNLFMFNTCTVEYKATKGGSSDELEDFRFGRAPDARLILMEHKSDRRVVTTNVAIATSINRTILFSLISLFWIFCVIGALNKLRK